MSTNEFLADLLTQYKQTEINQVAKLPTGLQKNCLFAIKGLLINVLQTIYPDIELYLALDNYANIVVLNWNSLFTSPHVTTGIILPEKYKNFIFYTNYNFEILINLSFIDYRPQPGHSGRVTFIQYDKPAIDNNIITTLINLGDYPYIKLRQKDAWISPQLPLEFDHSNYTLNFNAGHIDLKETISSKFKDILDGSKPFIHPKIYIDFLHFNNDNAQITQYANLNNNCDNLVGQIADCKNTNVELTQSLSRAELKARQKRNCIAPIESHKYRAGSRRRKQHRRKTFKNKHSK